MLTRTAHFHRPQPRFLDGMERVLGALAVALAHMRRRRRHARDLRHLLELDDRLLADIGVSRAEVERLASVPSPTDAAWHPGLDARR